jgi:MFS family permease
LKGRVRKDNNSGNDKDVTIKQGLRQNLSQFVILIVVNAFVGAMVGLEQTVGIWVVVFANSMLGWIMGMSLLGVGTAFVYPTLLAAISDVAHRKWRATSLGVYRFWRDLGFVFGAIGIGFLADRFGANIAINSVA